MSPSSARGALSHFPPAIRHILFPLDGSDLSERALAPALTLAAGLGAAVTLLRAVPPVTVQEKNRLDARERGLGERLETEMRQDTENYLRGLAQTHRTAGVAVQPVVTDEPAAEAVLHYADTRRVDVVAISTHGRAGLWRWIYGSVTDKALHGGHCSMLVTRTIAPDAQRSGGRRAVYQSGTRYG